MQQAKTAPGPPSSAREHGHNGIASVRLRRTSAKALETSKADGGDSKASLRLQSPSNQEAGNDTGSSTLRGAAPREIRKDSRREELFTFEKPRGEQMDSGVTIATLQENLTAITAFSQREKALSASLREEIARLTEALAKLHEEREGEKLEHDKINTLQKERSTSDTKERFLPDINSGATLAATTAALQQQTQMEVSYQRKVLSLENRCLHMTKNSKKLLAKIQQLETIQTEMNSQLRTLQQDNVQLSSEADNLKSTISSQSALIIGLRATVQKLTDDKQLVDSLRKSLEHCQRDLDVTKNREKMLHEEYAKFKATASQEKESMMSKILGFQQHLQRSDTAGGNLAALEMMVKNLQKEKTSLVVKLDASNSRCGDLQARITQLDELSEEFVQVKRTMEMERTKSEAELSAKNQELDSYINQLQDAEAQIHEAETRILEAEARSASLQEIAKVVDIRDEEVGTLMQKVIRLEGDLEDQGQRNTGLLDEVHKLNIELQNLKQLSHDETVQALQMARQKAANYEALTLLNEEKRALEEQLRLVQDQLEVERVTLQGEKYAKEQLLAGITSNALTIDELRKENVALQEKIEQIQAAQKVVPEVVEADVQTDEEHISPEVLAQTEGELVTLRDEFDEFRQKKSEVEVGLKRLISREKYKSESFQNQLKLLQNENAELSEKVEGLCKELVKERQLSDTQTLELTDLKSRVMSRDSIYLLRKTQDSLEQTVTALVESEHASESTFTCLQCMQLFTTPVTLAPCGHTYCAACLAKNGNVDVPSTISCTMCEEGINPQTECIFPNHALADLTARFVFRQQSLSALTSMCLSLRNSFTNRSNSFTAQSARQPEASTTET